ncbi:MAG TPA: hypothetical protein VLH94_00860 [Spirochaetia bacterium]|nr:hypothetical protein [Spirochaetia bacterium]
MKRWLAIIISSLLLVLFIYPSAFIYTQDTLPDRNDTRLITYIIGQVQDNLINHQPLFYGRFFAPDQNTLAYSDLFLTSSLVTLPFRLFTDSPIVIFNLAFIINSVLTSCSAFLLFFYLFKNNWIAITTTLLFTLSGFHLHYYPHLQMFSLWPFLLSIYFFLRFQKEKRPLFLTLFFITTTLQIFETIFLAYLIFFTFFILFLTSPQKPYKTIIVYLLPFLPIWILFILPYLQLHLSFPEASRPIRDAAHFSLGLEQPFTMYHSLTLIGIFLLAFLTKVKIKQWWPIFLFSLTMSFGPVVKILGQTVKIFELPIPLPYTIFYYLFPGFTGFRTPSRFIVLTLLSATVIIGFSFIPLINKLKIKTKIFLTFFIFSLLLLEADLPLKGFPVNINMHPVYQQVAALPQNAVILELPIKLWNMPDNEIESIRSLYSLSHRHRRLGGYSGFATNNWINLIEKINTNGLNTDNLKQLHTLGVTHYIKNNQLFPLP